MDDTDVSNTAPNHQQALTPPPSPFDLSNWLIVAETDSSADDSSSIVVLSMNDWNNTNSSSKTLDVINNPKQNLLWCTSQAEYTEIKIQRDTGIKRMHPYCIWIIFQRVYKSLHKSEARYEFYNHIISQIMNLHNMRYVWRY